MRCCASYDRAPQTREILLGKARFLSLQKRSIEVEEIYNTLLARDPLDGAALAGWAGNLMVWASTSRPWRPSKLIHRGGAATRASSMARPAPPQGWRSAKGGRICAGRDCGVDPLDQARPGAARDGLAPAGPDERDEELERLMTGLIHESGSGSACRLLFHMDGLNAGLGRLSGAPASRTGTPTLWSLEQSLRGGTQTEGMLIRRRPRIGGNLRIRIRGGATLSLYVGFGHAIADEKHVLPGALRAEGFLGYAGAWSSLLRDQRLPRQSPASASGWISSCYYVTVLAGKPLSRNPATVGSPSASRQCR